MAEPPPTLELEAALRAAGAAHHDYEQGALGGHRDEQWPGWYAAYVLGRLGDFTTPTLLSEWLEAVSSEGDWYENAAAAVHVRLRG